MLPQKQQQKSTCIALLRLGLNHETPIGNTYIAIDIPNANVQ
jgi:hypothetical protein